MIINSDANDIVYTAAVSGVNANFLKPSLEAMGITEDMWKNTKKIDFGKELSAAEAEAKAWKQYGLQVTVLQVLLTVQVLKI